MLAGAPHGRTVTIQPSHPYMRFQRFRAVLAQRAPVALESRPVCLRLNG
jgi:hypothetical protein